MRSQRVSGTAVQRTIAVLGSAVFFVVAPCTLAGLSITGWQLRPPFLGLELTRDIGAIMILAGVPGLVDAFARFALQGLGTPAPIAPTRNLVVTGLYRYVRNPIYVAVVAIILGQAVLMGDWRLIVYGALLLARLPRLRRGVRRTHARADVWERVRGVPRRRPALDTADDPMAVEMIGGPRLCEPLLATGLERFTGAASRHANGPRKKTSPHWRSGWVSGASQRATTNSLGTTSQPCASLPPWHSGFNQLSWTLGRQTSLHRTATSFCHRSCHQFV